MFARAIHKTAMPFKAFEHHTWQEFFHALRCAFHILSTEMIGANLLHLEYTNIMAKVLCNLKQFIMICLTLDGATNVQGKQIINLMACGPMAIFLEHFSMELRRESVENLYKKLIDCKCCLLLTIRELAPGFISQVVNSDACDDNADPQQVATLNEHFVGTLMFTFCSDSPSVMIKLRRLCIQDTEFLFAFGCSPHALHNLCMDLVKEFPVVKLIVKQIVFLVKSIRKTHLIQQLFDKICKEKYGITLVLILFTKTRWGTVRDTAKRLNRVRTAMCQLPTEFMSNNLDIDLLKDLRDLILTAAFWKGLVAVEVLFSVICSCLSYLEGDESTFSSVYAYFLAIAHHFRTLPSDVTAALDFNNADVDKMHTLVCHRLKTIFSPTHALAFRTDPLFDDLHDNLAKLHRDDFLNLGDLTILQQCKKAIKRMAAADVLLNRLMQFEFGLYTIRVEDDEDDFADVFSMPQHMWALADDLVYSHLKKPLLAIHKMPTGASAGERNHKLAN